MFGWELRDIVALMAFAGTAGGLLIAYVRYSLTGDFAKGGDMTALAARVSAAEERINRMPSHDDIKGLNQRIGEVERGVSTVNARLEGQTALLQRIEHQANLLLEHSLEKEKS